MTQPDKTPTDLLIQQGPSCWLYVVEAIAAASTAKTQLSTTHLRMAMRCYPDSDSVRDAHAAQKHDPKRPKRTIALELMAANIAGMVGSLQNWALTSDTDDIPLSRVQEFARRHHVSRSAWQDPALGVFFDGDGDDPTTDVTGLITAFQAGAACAEGLHKLAIGAGDDKNVVGLLLNTGYQVIDGKQEVTDVVLSLGVQSVPSYISVRKRFKTTAEQRASGIVDLTGRELSELADTAHALLLEGFTATSESAGRVTFKDPNFGNVLFVVTVAQFQAMAGKDEVKMRPFFPSGAKKSALATILG